MNNKWLEPSIRIIALDIMDITLPDKEVAEIAERLIDNFDLEEGIDPYIIENAIAEYRREAEEEAVNLQKELDI
jgi:hypothetical protein